MKKLIIFVSSLILVLCLVGYSKEASSVGIVGGADGPDATFLTSQIHWINVCKLISVVVIVAILIAVIVYLNRKKK